MVWVMAGLDDISNVEEQGDWNGFEMVWWCVYFIVGHDLAAKAEINFAMGAQAGVWIPHTKEHLGDAL